MVSQSTQLYKIYYTFSRAIAFELSLRANVSGRRKDSIEASFVTGHDSPRRIVPQKPHNRRRALAPAGCHSHIEPNQPLFCSLFNHYATGVRGVVEIESEWTAGLRGPLIGRRGDPR
jgi:hypothetical protein